MTAVEAPSRAKRTSTLHVLLGLHQLTSQGPKQVTCWSPNLRAAHPQASHMAKPATDTGKKHVPLREVASGRRVNERSSNLNQRPFSISQSQQRFDLFYIYFFPTSRQSEGCQPQVPAAVALSLTGRCSLTRPLYQFL